jgi:MFS family permease
MPQPRRTSTLTPALLDLTIVSIAIPSMQRGLHASLAEIGWVINAYVIVLAVLMITAGCTTAPSTG